MSLPVYEITEVPTFELRRIVTDGDGRRIGFVGMFKTLELAQGYIEQMKALDAAELGLIVDAG